MKKLSILFDTNKENTKNVYRAYKNLEGDLKDKTEVWVGCSESGGFQVREWVKKLKKFGKKVFLFPGRIRQAVFSLGLVDYILNLHLLNYSSLLIRLKVALGHLLILSTNKRLDLGYFVFKSDTKVSKKVGAKEINDDEVIKRVKKFVKKKKPYGVYLEGGSGAKESVPEALVKKVRKEIDCKLYVGGGIRKPEEAKKYFDLGADRVVVSSVFEKDDWRESKKLMETFLETI